MACYSGNKMIVVHSCKETACIEKNIFVEEILEREQFPRAVEHLQGVSMSKFRDQCRDQPCVLSLVCEHTRSVFLCYEEMLDKECLSRLVVGSWVHISSKGTHVIYLQDNRFEQLLLDTIRQIFPQIRAVQNKNYSNVENVVDKSQSHFRATRLTEEEEQYDDCVIGVAEDDIYDFINNNVVDKRREDGNETFDTQCSSETHSNDSRLSSERVEDIYKRTLKSDQPSEVLNQIFMMTTKSTVPFTTAKKNVESQSEQLGRVRRFRDISSSSGRNNFTGQNRFVQVSTLEPSEEVVGIHVWGPVCFPEDSSLHIPSMIPQTFNNTKDRDLLRKFIMGRHIPDCIYENNLTELAELLLCDCMIIKSETIDKIELICFSSSLLMCDQEQFIKASQFVFASLLNNIGDGPTVRDLTYSFILLLSMVYLRALTNTTSSRQHIRFTRELLHDFVSQLSKCESQNNLGESSRGFIRGLEIFLRRLSCRIEKEYSILQMGDWDQALKRESNTKFLVEAVSKMDVSEQIALTFLLINMLNRLGSSVLPLAGVLADIAAQIIAPYKKTKKEQKRAVSQTYRYLLARSCKHILLHQQLSNVSGKSEFIENMKKLIQLTMDTKDKVNEAVCDSLKSLVFHKNRDIRKLIISKTNVLENLKSTSFEYVTHQLRQARLCLHSNSAEKKKSDFLPAWAMHSGSMGSQEVDVWCLIPSNQCILDRFQEDYKDKADKRETDAALNTLETLRSLQRNGVHKHVVQLLAYQCLPMPLFFVVENPQGVKLIKYLIFRRENKEWLSYSQLALIVSESLRAISYLHDNDVLHRDITTAQFKICPDTFHVKLENFRVSKRTPNKQDYFYTADRALLAVRWLARESLLYDKFSVGTDIWMFGHFILEIFTHGCWPFTEHRDKETGDIMEMVIKGNLNPRHPPCVPDEIFKLILRCFDEEEHRITSDELSQSLEEYTSLNVDANRKGKESLRAVWTKSEQYPPISLAQKRNNYLPELTIPSVILSMKITGDTKYYNIFEGRSAEKNAITEADLVTSMNQPNFLKRTTDLIVTEPLTQFAINNTIPYRQTLKKLMDIESIEISYENDGYMQMINRYPLGCRLREFAIQTQDSLEVLEKLLQLAKCIQKFHRARWLVRCISARDVWIGLNGEVYFLRLSRACPLPADVEWVIGEPFDDRRHWMPPEILHSDYDKMYTTASDIYQFGMTAFEVYQILSLPDGHKSSLSSVPLADVSKYKLLDALHKGQYPPQPARCPDEIYGIMEWCWYRERIRRPDIGEIIEKMEIIIMSRRSKRDAVHKLAEFNKVTAEDKICVDKPLKTENVARHDFNVDGMPKANRFHQAKETARSRLTRLGMTGSGSIMPTFRRIPEHESFNTETYTKYDNYTPHGSRDENEGHKNKYKNCRAPTSINNTYENGSLNDRLSLASMHETVEYTREFSDDDHMNKTRDSLLREANSWSAASLSSASSVSKDFEHCYDNNDSDKTSIQGVTNTISRECKIREFTDNTRISSMNQDYSNRSENIGKDEGNKHEMCEGEYPSELIYMNRARNSIPLLFIPKQKHSILTPENEDQHASAFSMFTSIHFNHSAREKPYIYHDLEEENRPVFNACKITGRDASKVHVPFGGLVADEKVHVYDYAVFEEDNQGSVDSGYLEANTSMDQHEIHGAHSHGNKEADFCSNDDYLEAVTMRQQREKNATGTLEDRDVSFSLMQSRRSNHRVSDTSVVNTLGHTLGDGTTLYEIRDISNLHGLDKNVPGGGVEKDKQGRSDHYETRSQSNTKNVFARSNHRVSDISMINTTGHTLGEGTTLYEIRDISDIPDLEDIVQGGGVVNN